MSEVSDLAILVRANTPLIALETREESRVVDTFRHVVARVLRPLYRWSLTDGLKRLDLDGQDEDEPAPDTTQTLIAIKGHASRGIYLMCDFHPYLRYAMTLRLTREIVARQGAAEHTLVLIAPAIELPPELQDTAVRFAFSPPDEAQLKQLVRDEAAIYTREHGGRRVQVEPKALQAMVRNLRGLMLPDARRIARHLIVRDGAIGLSDLPELAKLKFELLNKNGLLRFEYDPAQFGDVAGLSRLKTWVAQRRAAYQG
jgi:MoxR-like ATPase